MKYQFPLLAVVLVFFACGEGIVPEFHSSNPVQPHLSNPAQPEETNPRKLIADFDSMTGLDARNGYLTWVKTFRYSGIHEAVVNGGEVYATDTRTMMVRLVAVSGAGPAVDEKGRVGYAVIQPNNCVKIMVEQRFIITNCGRFNYGIKQMTTASFHKGWFVFTMKRNYGTFNEAKDNQLFSLREDQNLLVINRFEGSVYRPRIHGDEVSFQQWSHTSVDAVIFNLLNDASIGRIPLLDCSRFDFDFGGRWSVLLAIKWQNEQTLAGIWTFDRITGKTWQNIRPMHISRLFVNDEGTIIMWMESDGINDGFRFMEPKITSDDWKVSELYRAREAVLDGRDIYYIAPDETGHDALYVYKVP